MKLKIRLSVAAVILGLINVVSFGQELTPIFIIQGKAERTSLEDENIRTSGVVTDVFNGTMEFGGYFIQDTLGDDDMSTSDGIYVRDIDNDQHLNIGDYIEFNATVTEFFNRTQLTDVSEWEILRSNMSLPTPIEVKVNDSTFDLEQVEGMLVTYPEKMVITGNQYSGQLRFGELTLAPDLLSIPTELWDPNDDPASGTSWSGRSNVDQILEIASLNSSSSLIVDDRSGSSDPMSFPFADELETLTARSTIDSLTGVMNFTFGNYKLEFPNADHPYHRSFEKFSPNALVDKDNDIRIMSFNVENYYTSLGERGAADQAQFELQTSKLAQAISASDADIIALQELENNEDAILQLTEAVNEHNTAELYNYIRTASIQNGGDDIQTAFLYKTDIIEPVNSAYNIGDESIFDRRPLAQRFRNRQIPEQEVLLINVHLKSKSCSNASELNEDQNDGQACFNDLRRLQAETIINYVRSEELLANEIIDILILGDFNAYSQEDPMDLLRDGGLFDETQLTEEEIMGNSFQFRSQHGRLDHVFASQSTASKISRVQYWGINSRFSDLMAYDSYNPDFIATGVERCSDHDPLIIDYGDLQVSTEDRELSNDVLLYFNSGSETIEITSNKSKLNTILLYNALGQIIYSSSSSNRNVYKIRTTSLRSGIYYVRFGTSNNGFTTKPVFVY